MMPEVIVSDPGRLRQRLTSEFENLARVAFAARGQFLVALPGGSVAMTFFPALSNIGVDWPRTDFFWVDERAVPPGDPDSNCALAVKLWLGPARVPLSRIHRMRGEEPDLHRAARLAAEELVTIAGNPPRLDIVLIGVGEDGHIASIFANRDMPELFVAPVYDAPKPPPSRLTLTLPVLAGAGRVIVAAMGQGKAPAIRDAFAQHDRATPIGELLRRSSSVLVLLDQDAAALLKTRESSL
jgi:6-phosphogluconolactonase